MNRAIGRVGTALVVMMLILVGMVTYWQVVEASDLKRDPLNVRGALADINEPRGPIVTADGVVVAESKPSDDDTEFEFQRVYPAGPLYQQVVGYQSFLLGSTGVERTYNDELVGRDPELRIRNITSAFSDEPTGTVVLSIRADLQQAAFTALRGQRGSVVAIDPRTGEILAMYSNPTYDPNPLVDHRSRVVREYNDALIANPDKPDLARAYRERYPPGSTFKALTAAVAIENGVSSPDRVYPQLSSITPPQTTSAIRNFGGDTCGGSLAESFRQSCNTTFAQIGLDLGETFVTGLAQFGIGASPPIDLVPAAAVSTGPEPGSFDDDQPRFALAGIGQGPVFATPLQMALAAAGIANGGVIMRPHVVKEIRDAEDNVVRQIEDREWKTAVSPGTASAVAAMMVAVVESGTGTAAQISGVSVAGKTGTAEAPNGRTDAWFITFAPAEAPEIAIAVVVEGGGSFGNEATGGRVAAPIAAAVMRAYLGR